MHVFLSFTGLCLFVLESRACLVALSLNPFIVVAGSMLAIIIRLCIFASMLAFVAVKHSASIILPARFVTNSLVFCGLCVVDRHARRKCFDDYNNKVEM